MAFTSAIVIYVKTEKFEKISVDQECRRAFAKPDDCTAGAHATVYFRNEPYTVHIHSLVQTSDDMSAADDTVTHLIDKFDNLPVETPGIQEIGFCGGCFLEQQIGQLEIDESGNASTAMDVSNSANSIADRTVIAQLEVLKVQQKFGLSAILQELSTLKTKVDLLQTKVDAVETSATLRNTSVDSLLKFVQQRSEIIDTQNTAIPLTHNRLSAITPTETNSCTPNLTNPMCHAAPPPTTTSDNLNFSINSPELNAHSGGLGDNSNADFSNYILDDSPSEQIRLAHTVLNDFDGTVTMDQRIPHDTNDQMVYPHSQSNAILQHSAVSQPCDISSHVRDSDTIAGPSTSNYVNEVPNTPNRLVSTLDTTSVVEINPRARKRHYCSAICMKLSNRVTQRSVGHPDAYILGGDIAQSQYCISKDYFEKKIMRAIIHNPKVVQNDKPRLVTQKLLKAFYSIEEFSSCSATGTPRAVKGNVTTKEPLCKGRLKVLLGEVNRQFPGTDSCNSPSNMNKELRKWLNQGCRNEKGNSKKRCLTSVFDNHP